MARLLRLTRRPFTPLKPPSPPPFAVPAATLAARTYISDMRQSAFKETLLRMLRTYISGNRPPRPAAQRFESFWVEDHPGELWVQLHRHHRSGEKIKIDATMFEGGPPPQAAEPGSAAVRRHVSLIVEVSKDEPSDLVLNFICSAWPDALDVESVYPAVRGVGAIKPYMGPEFRELDDELQNAVRDYLEERGVNDELAEFLHDYMINKDRSELLRWLKNVVSYVKK